MACMSALNPRSPGLSEVVDAIFSQTWKAPMESDPWLAAVARVVERSALDHLIELAQNDRAASGVRAVATAKIKEWAEGLANPRRGERYTDAAHRDLALADIHRFLTRPSPEAKSGDRLPAPPGSPIGTDPR